MTQNYSIPANIWAGLNFPVSIAGAIYFVGADGLTISVDPLNFYVNPTSKFLSIGTGGDTAGTNTLNAYYQFDSFVVKSSQGTINSDQTMASFTVSSCRGTGISPQISQPSDNIGVFAGWGYCTGGWTSLAGIAISAQGINTGNLGGQIDFYTKVDGAATFQNCWSIDNAGALWPATVGIANSLGTASHPVAQMYRYGVLNTSGGNQTINTPSGSFRIMAGQTTVVINNSYVDANSLVLLTLKTNDTTAKSCIAIPTSGGFTATLNAAATANVDVMFFTVRTLT